MASKDNQKPRLIQIMAGAEFGGAETAFSDACIALHTHGYEQLIITRKAAARNALLRKAGMTVIELPFGGFFDVYTKWQISRQISKFKPDIVQTWMSRATAKLPKKKGRNYTVVARLGGYYKLKYYGQADHFIGNTPYICDYIRENGISADRVHLITNFSATNLENDPPVKRSDLNTPEDALVLLTLSRYHSVKALDIGIKAIKDIPNAHFWCAGQGPEEENLKALAASEGVSNRVHFLGWRSDRAALFKAADMCLFISREEPFGTVFCQAWQNKTPLIVSDTDGPKQFVKDGEDALMIPINDVEATRKAVVKLRDNPDLAKQLVKKGYERFQAEFSEQSTLAAYDALYEKIRPRAS